MLPAVRESIQTGCLLASTWILDFCSVCALHGIPCCPFSVCYLLICSSLQPLQSQTTFQSPTDRHQRCLREAGKTRRGLRLNTSGTGRRIEVEEEEGEGERVVGKGHSTSGMGMDFGATESHFNSICGAQFRHGRLHCGRGQHAKLRLPPPWIGRKNEVALCVLVDSSSLESSQLRTQNSAWRHG